MKRRMTREDVRQITRLVREQYSRKGGRGKPIIEVGQKYLIGDGLDTMFFDHNGVEDGTYDLFDNWELADVHQMSRRGDPSLLVYPGFVLDLYIYIPDLIVDGVCIEIGEIWGNLDAQWTGDEWEVYCPFVQGQRGRHAGKAKN
jgi:hypothetical protein